MKHCPATPRTPNTTDPLSAPRWAVQLADAAGPAAAAPGCIDATVSSDGMWSLVRGRITDANAISDAQLTDATALTYAALLKTIAQTSAPHAVRAWNVVPEIHRTERPGTDRYMAFNAGRHAAYAQWFGGDQTMARTMPTASAVGYDGADLGICILGHASPGRAIENPRQVPAFRYSPRFGQVPPSFVRATVMPHHDGAARVLVAGTASVVGEDSHHCGNLQGQLEETFRNLAVVLLSATTDRPPINGHMSGHEREALGRYESARVYVRHPHDLPAVESAVRAYLPNLRDLELVRADICRPELLVEIEGVAMLPIQGRITNKPR